MAYGDSYDEYDDTAVADSYVDERPSVEDIESALSYGDKQPTLDDNSVQHEYQTREGMDMPGSERYRSAQAQTQEVLTQMAIEDNSKPVVATKENTVYGPYSGNIRQAADMPAIRPSKASQESDAKRFAIMQRATINGVSNPEQLGRLSANGMLPSSMVRGLQRRSKMTPRQYQAALKDEQQNQRQMVGQQFTEYMADKHERAEYKMLDYKNKEEWDRADTVAFTERMQKLQDNNVKAIEESANPGEKLIREFRANVASGNLETDDPNVLAQYKSWNSNMNSILMGKTPEGERIDPTTLTSYRDILMQQGLDLTKVFKPSQKVERLDLGNGRVAEWNKSDSPELIKQKIETARDLAKEDIVKAKEMKTEAFKSYDRAEDTYNTSATALRKRQSEIAKILSKPNPIAGEEEKKAVADLKEEQASNATSLADLKTRFEKKVASIDKTYGSNFSDVESTPDSKPSQAKPNSQSGKIVVDKQGIKWKFNGGDPKDKSNYTQIQ